MTDSSENLAALELPAASGGRNRFALAAWLFLRLLAVVHLIAFVSLWVQLDGLIGPRGLLPAARYFTIVREQIGSAASFQLPSLCWIFGTERFLHVLCAGGVVFSLLLFAGIAPALSLAVLWVAYLSLSCAGQIFFNFQWDALLLETTLLAIFLAPWSWLPLWRMYEPPRLARLLLWWLLFRLMFFAGVVKLASGDLRWRDLSALTFHYETQPLPTPVAWSVHQFPAWWHRAECAGMFVIELLVPFFLFAPRSLRHNAAFILAAFMGVVALTGNYTFFNLLAIALCLLCFDDAAWKRMMPDAFSERMRLPQREPVLQPPWHRWAIALPAALIFAYTFFASLPVLFRQVGHPPGFSAVANIVAPFRSLNNYGLFAVMTNPRPELIFEGSDDSREWHPYEFPHKPGDLVRAPTWVAPHQPRLDWQLWFAALGPPAQNRWVLALCEHLLHGTPDVLTLFAKNPFPAKPPRYIRVVRYEYHFTGADTRRRTGQWWHRTPLDFYVPAASLR